MGFLIYYHFLRAPACQQKRGGETTLKDLVPGLSAAFDLGVGEDAPSGPAR